MIALASRDSSHSIDSTTNKYNRNRQININFYNKQLQVSAY